MRKSIALLTSVVFFVGCSTQSPMPSNFKVKATQPDVQGSPSGVPALDVSKIPPPPKFQTPVNDVNAVRADEPKLNFDVLPPADIDTVDGAITVIYKNSAKVRLGKSGKSLSSLSSTGLFEMDSMLKNNGLMGGSDLGNDKMTDAEMDKMQEDFQAKNNVDIPHLKSIHYYQLAKGTDTKSLCKTLMKLPYVRLAYPTLKTSPTTTTQIGVTQNNETTANPFFDPFCGDPGTPSACGLTIDNHWFNEHQVFKAQNYYNNITSSLPKIAVIDSGFDRNSIEINYAPGYSVTEPSPGVVQVDQSGSSTCTNNLCIQENSSSSSSHGSEIASVAAGNKNNGVGGVGIMPNSIILPIKSYNSVNCLAKAIRVASDDSSVSAINVSISLTSSTEEVPLSYDPTVNSAISYAVSNRGIPVALSVGNGGKLPGGATHNNTSNTYAVVVGGTMPDPSNSSKYIGWDNSTYYSGSSNDNPIDIAASARNVGVYGFNPSTNSSSYGYANGCSLATPMVAATLGAMKKLNPTLTGLKLKDIVIFSSTLRKYSNSTFIPARYIGKNLQYSATNNGLVAGIRDLNMYNALLIAKNVSSYQAITRSYNIDDYVSSVNTQSYNTYSPYNTIDTYGTDIIYGLSSIPTSGYLNFQEYNSSVGCTYGYQVFRNVDIDTSNKFDKFGGVSGVTGVPSGCGGSNTWNYPMSYYYF